MFSRLKLKRTRIFAAFVQGSYTSTERNVIETCLLCFPTTCYPRMWLLTPRLLQYATHTFNVML